MAEPTRRRGRPRSAPESPGTVQVLDRALEIMHLLAAHRGLTLSEIADQTGQPPSTVHRMLATLAAHEMAERDEATQAWGIGPASFRLGTAFLQRAGIVERATPILRALMRHTTETANLGIAGGEEALLVAQVESGQTIRASFPPGARLPLHASGIGKALLAFGQPDRLPAPQTDRLTDNTLTTEQALRDDMARTRARGFSLDNEEQTRGLICIAAPVLDATGAVIAAIGISAPSQRVGHEHVKTLGAAVIAAASDLSRAMGG